MHRCFEFSLTILLIGLLFIGNLSAAPVGDDSFDADDESKPKTRVTPSGSNGVNKLRENLDNLKERVTKSREVLTGIATSFSSSPQSEEKLEEALGKYDEIVEDIEADFTKTKIELGLKLEENLRSANSTLDQLGKQLHNLNTEFINMAATNRAQLTESLHKSIFQFNDFLSAGVERFLDFSEFGKDVLRNFQRRRPDSRRPDVLSTEDQG